MKKIMRVKRWMGLGVCLFLAAVGMVPLSSAADMPAMVVGRIFLIEGDLLRYVPEEKDWVALVRDAPFSTEDTLFSGEQGMAELIIPNGTWIRVGNNTQIQFIALDTDFSEADMASGLARFYNKSSDTVIKATSPFGYVLANPGTVFDFYVGENSVEVVAVKGTVSFIHSATDARFDVSVGSPSILADQQQVSSGEGTVDPDWDRWNKVRENFWAAKARVRGRSVEYLPSSLQGDSYALEENGRWESVPYEGRNCWFWRPTTVAVGWSPFTTGRWTDWYGDQIWIPAEPFGYVTHHYGNWIYARNYWYWAPPVVAVRIGLPLLDIGFFWSPGRVSWIHRGAYVGWVPLAPRETYYSHRHWGGPHDVVVTRANQARININLRNYAYASRAVVVDRDNFYKVNNYAKVRVTNLNSATLIDNYRAAPVVNNTVIKGYTADKQRHNLTNVKVNEKPHNTVINRIQQNQAVIREGRKEKASVVQERVKGVPEGKINREARIETPKVMNRIVPAAEMNRPKSEIKFQQREIRTGGKPGLPEKPAVRPERVAPARPGQQEKPDQPAKPERVSPARPAQPVPPAARPERVAPARPGQPEKPAARPERAAPPKPSRQEQPIQPERPDRVSPARPAQPVPPAARPERVAPARPGQPEKPAARPERAAPPKPSRQEQPIQPERPDRVSPARPAQPEPPAARPERVAPARPVQPEKPAARPERAAPPRPSQQEQPRQPVKPERVSPARPAQPEPPAARPERVAPARPVQPEKPAARPERAAPPKPSQQEQPRQPARPEQVTPAKPAQPQQPTARPEPVPPAKPAQPEPPAARPERATPPKPSQQEQPRQPARPEQVSPAKPVPPVPPAAKPERAAPAKPAEKVPVQEQIEKPKEQRPSEKDEEKPKEQKHPEEEKGKSR